MTMHAEEGFRGPVEVTALGLPHGLEAKPVVLWPDAPSGTLEIRHDLSVLSASPDTGWAQARFRVHGTARIEGKELSRQAELPPFYTEDGAGYNEAPATDVLASFVEPPMFAMRVEQPFRGFRLDLNSGGTVEVPVAISRADGFDSGLQLEPIGFPQGLRLTAGAEREGMITAVLEADPDQIERRPHRVAIRASANWGGRPLTEVTSGFTVQVK